MITIIYAALLGLLYVGLTLFVVHGRWTYKIGLGDGNNSAMQRRIRMHGNFAEYVPLALILLLLIDYAEYPGIIVHGLGIALVVGRIAHAVGIHESPNFTIQRFIGMVLTLGMILVSSILLLWKFVALEMIGF
jgi:uncharacterized membrane protein YecN with MAPEG domain